MRNFSRLTQNPTFIKVLSVLVAFSLWLYVMAEDNPNIERTYSINLEKRNIPSGLVVAGSQDKIRIKISGPMSLVSDISENSINAYVDLEGLEPGTYERQVLTTLPGGVRIVEVFPLEVQITAESKISRTFPVNIRYNSQLPAELTLQLISVDPNIVTVTGSASAIESISQVEAVFNLEANMHAKGEYNGTIYLTALDASNNAINSVLLEPGLVLVTVEVADQITTKEVPVRLNYLGTLPPGHRIASATITPERVTLTGPVTELEEIKEVSVQGINLNFLNNTYQSVVGLELPEGITADAEAVEVILQIQPQQS